MDTTINIKNYLPHRKPMLMVDMILIMDDEKVETIFEIKGDNIFIQKNTFIEAGLIENAAQTCSSIVAKDYFVDENNEDKSGVDVVGFISAIKTLKIHKLPEVGSTIKTISTLVSKFVTDDYSLCTMSCKTFNNEELLLEGEINLFIQENHSKQ
ncbi:ABC transporter permease [Flavobacterium psychrophilum]|uniref:Probable acyl carrier protein involved in flexirubin-type pigment biosynthesis DarC2 n=1 Tax=Flavobacterium psychrophilum (strain ATCC 49511 / DSM 21280 / CIP 103535 / JIP02/86) TaxID=402612 RepID=A6H1V9_FLAPJ|nr:flexirubin biosynthesis protein [Flavobacterium psychrophilum]AIG31003.1 ABC transporter permease [Flavobacterium psychrophilum]AIG33280.1 ABC transporter permease [Flavobacterium psychrophilum]AIG35429.1 ABC transporter permease [Flavobacterium psychrophilum]AIG37790.1 ABC transporter permease [Flavobacterium psychrophilum]AIG40061.1 ABC transporter permease [Flavobacterium psychrophilum]